MKVAQFEACIAAGECSSANYNTFETNALCNEGRGAVWADHPMNCVNWHGANEYCAWIGGRLPTDEEWEYASTHNGTEHLNIKYAFGDTLQHCVNVNYYDSTTSMYCDGHEKSETKIGTSPVGAYSPEGDSPLGLVDMSGNVWEWTDSLYLSDVGGARVFKGGSWELDEYHLAVTYRYAVAATDRMSFLGFRCAK